LQFHIQTNAFFLHFRYTNITAGFFLNLMNEND
jgi:hypothetical protein